MMIENKMRKYLYICLFLVFVIGAGISKNVSAEGITEIISAETTTSIRDMTTAKLPKAVRKFVKKKMTLKQITLESKTSVKLTWKKMSDADGYIIYRRVKGGKFRKLKKVRTQKQSGYIDKKVKYGNKYIYTIKAYKKHKGKIYYSDYSLKGRKKKIKVKLKYKNGYKSFYDMDNVRIKNVEPFLNKPVYCLKVNLVASVVTVYAKDGEKGYTIPVKAYLCSGNTWDRTGTFSLGVKYRFRTLYYGCYSQWASRIHDDILFHTVPYTRSQNPNSLDVKQYNLLGTPASHGCIRLQCIATKWINEHCPSGTKVVMYKSDNPGPLGKPKLEKIPSWHTWDPTDPTMQYKCKRVGCNHKKIL